MFNGQNINMLYVLGVVYATYSISTSIRRKKEIGESILNIDNVKSGSRNIIVGILTILIVYMLYISVVEYNLAKGAGGASSILQINFILELLFWVSIYSTFLYAQFGKRYIGENGLSLGTRGYTWRKIKKFSFSDNQLAITVEEMVLFKIRNRGYVVYIPMDKVREATNILRGKVKG